MGYGPFECLHSVHMVHTLDKVLLLQEGAFFVIKKLSSFYLPLYTSSFDIAYNTLIAYNT